MFQKIDRAKLLANTQVENITTAPADEPQPQADKTKPKISKPRKKAVKASSKTADSM